MYSPSVLALVATVNVEVFEVASVILKEAGVKVAPAPIGKPVALRTTVPVKPAKGVTATEYTALSPGITAIEDGVTVI